MALQLLLAVVSHQPAMPGLGILQLIVYALPWQSQIQATCLDLSQKIQQTWQLQPHASPDRLKEEVCCRLLIWFVLCWLLPVVLLEDCCLTMSCLSRVQQGAVCGRAGFWWMPEA